MDKMKISFLSGAALLGLTVTASAGPMSVTSPQSLRPQQSEITSVAYYHYYRPYRHHYRHYGYRHHYRHYAYYRHHRYYYGWNPVGAAAGAAVGLATLPFAWATGGYYGYPYYYYY